MAYIEDVNMLTMRDGQVWYVGHADVIFVL